MSRIPDDARVAPGANYTGWQTWADAAVASSLDKIINDPSDNPQGKSTTTFAGMCALAELVHGGHLSKEDAWEQVNTAAKTRHNMPEKEIARQWRNALKRTETKPRLYEPANPSTSNGSGPPADDDLPAGYHMKKGRLVLIEYDRHGDQVTKPLADIGVQIKSVATAEDGTRSYHLRGAGWRSGVFELDITAEDFESEAKLRASIGSRCPLDPIYPRMSQHLPAAIKTVTNGDLRLIDRYHRTGWTAARRFLIPGLEPTGVEIHLPSDLPYSVAGGSLDQGLVALDALINALDPGLSTVVLSALFGAPLLHLLGLRNRRYGVFIVGRTGSLKTSWITTAMSIYGAGHVQDEQYIKWGQGSTQNAMMKLASMAQDLPLLIDNYKPNTGGGSRAFVNLMHAIIEGGEKKRLNRNSELRDSADIYTLPIFTGEALPGIDAAALARLLPLEFPWAGGTINEPLHQAQLLAEHLPAVGLHWLMWLASTNLDKFKEDYEDGRRVWADWLMTHKKETQNKLRVASNLAINALCWRVLCEAPSGLGELAFKYTAKHRLGLAGSAEMLNTSTDSALEATRFLAGLSQLVATGRVLIADIGDKDVLSMDRDRLIGWRDGAVTYLLPDLAVSTYRRQLDDRLNEFDANSVGRQLAALGHLLKTNEGRNKLLKRVHGERHWVWHVRSSLIWDESEDDEPIPLG